jgi:PAS domain S-box-containing protein
VASLYASQWQLRGAAEARLIGESSRRAAAIADFLAERRHAVSELAESQEIDAYLANRALGMSRRYGLNAALSFIEQRFRRQIEQKLLRGQPIYSRIVFRDETGAVLAEAGNDEERGPAPATAADSVQLITDTENLRVIASAPVIYKGELSGTVITITDLRLLARQLIAGRTTDAADATYHEHLITDAGAGVFPQGESDTLVLELGAALAALPARRLVAAADIPGAKEVGPLLVLRTPIAGTPLSTLTLTSEFEVYGQMASPAYALYPGAFSALLLLAAFGFERMRKRAVRLEEDYREADQRRAELDQRNEALSTEISRRRAVEAALHEKTEALDRLNGDLRIAAAAFDCQEGMVVADAEKVILRVNRAFTTMTGYTAEQIVGRPLRMLRSDRHGPDFFQEMWEAVDRTGGWQGEITDRSKDGELYTRWLTISAVKDGGGAVTHYIGAYYDVSERKRAEERIKELAFFDQLTGLPNRALLRDRMLQAINADARRRRHGALLFIDLDNFKTLNDTLGHDTGDLLLK